MNLRSTVLSLLAIVLIACGTSNIADDAEVSVTGSLSRSDDTPAAGVPVILLESPSGLDALAELVVTVSSVGILCLTRQVSFCKGAKRTTTDEQGRYAFTMKGKDAKTILGNPADFAISAELDSGPRIQARFEISKEALEVPPIRFWSPEGLAVSTGPQWVQYSWPAMESKPRPDEYRIEATVGGDELVWAQTTRPAGRLDARAIADIDGEFRAIAVVKHRDFTVEHYSQPIQVSGQAGAPPSRNADCTIAGRDEAAPTSPCLITDGRYDRTFPTQSCPPASPSPQPCAANTWITVDLGASRSVSAVFLHGLRSPADVALLSSPDGLHWTRQAGHRSTPYLALTLPAPITARYLRLEAAQGTISSLHELSAWP